MHESMNGVLFITSASMVAAYLMAVWPWVLMDGFKDEPPDIIIEQQWRALGEIEL